MDEEQDQHPSLSGYHKSVSHGVYIPNAKLWMELLAGVLKFELRDP